MTNYEQGFIEKCTQHGVNPEQLVKSAGLGSSWDDFVKLLKFDKWHKGMDKSIKGTLFEDALRAAKKGAGSEADELTNVNYYLNKPTPYGNSNGKSFTSELESLYGNRKTGTTSTSNIMEGVRVPFEVDGLDAGKIRQFKLYDQAKHGTIDEGLKRLRNFRDAGRSQANIGMLQSLGTYGGLGVAGLAGSELTGLTDIV